MCLIFTILFAFALGYAIKHRAVAVAIYLAVDAIVFSFQTLNLLLDWMAGSDSAFGPPPTRFPTSVSWSDIAPYGVVNVLITLAGVGLVLLGSRLATKRRGPIAAVGTLTSASS